MKRKLGKELRKLCKKYESNEKALTPVSTETNRESVLDYKPCIVSMLCNKQWVGTLL